MFQQGNFDIIPLTPPLTGMNQNVSPEQLSFNFAYALANVTTSPFGELLVRNGTRNIKDIAGDDSDIIDFSSFVSQNGEIQFLAYTRIFVEDGTVNNINVVDAFTFTFDTNNPARYIQDVPIKFRYAFRGIQTLTVIEDRADISVNNNTVTVVLKDNVFASPLNQVDIEAIFYSSATLYCYNSSTDTILPPLRENLTVGCVPYFTFFLRNLFIGNGVERIMRWDGANLTDTYDFVKETTQNLTRTGNTTLTFTIPAGFDISFYPVGGKIQIKVNGAPSEFTIVARNLVGQVLTITVDNNLPVFAPNQTNLFFQAFPPALSYLFVAYNRMWGLAPGASSIEYRNPDNAMRVYFMHKSGSITDWFNETTKTVPSIDLSENHGVPDNLEGMGVVGGYMLFFGREATQLWTGSEPLAGVNAEQFPTFTYFKTIPTGAVHRNLIMPLPNDLYFVSKQDVQSFSNLNVARELAVTPTDAVNPLVREYVQNAMSSNVNYRKCRSFKYTNGSLIGFKIGNSPVLCSLYSTSLYSWSIFYGDFEKASGFTTVGNALYLSIDNTICKYADGKDGSRALYGDNNGNDLIYFGWTLPVINVSGKKSRTARAFACKRYDTDISYPSSFTINKENKVFIEISGDLPKNYKITSPCRFQMRGDVLSQVPLTEDDPIDENSIGLRLEQPYSLIKDRLKFYASKFWVSLYGYTKNGPVSIKDMKFYGVIERS